MTDDIKKLTHTFRVHWDKDREPPRLQFWYDDVLCEPAKLDMTIKPDGDGVPDLSITIENRPDPFDYLLKDAIRGSAKPAHEQIRDMLREIGLEEKPD